MTLLPALRFASLVTSALSSGVLFGTLASLGPSTRVFSPGTCVEVQQATVRNLRPVMGVLLPAAVVSNLALIVGSARDRGRPGFVLVVTGCLGQLASLVVTAAVELPINADVLTWVPDDLPANWESVRDRWDRTHTLRTATSVLGFGCLAAASVVAPGLP